MGEYLTMDSNTVFLKYKKWEWAYRLEEISDLGLQKKRKLYSLPDIAVAFVTALSLYLMTNTNIEEVYYVVPLVIFYAFIVLLKCRHADKFIYYLVVKTNNGVVRKIKIDPLDRQDINREVVEFLSLKFERDIKRIK